MNPIIKSDIEDILKRLNGQIDVLSGKTILITGASGLIGSYILETLAYLNSSNKLSSPCKILAMQRKEITKENKLSYLLKRMDVEFISHNAAVSYDLPKKVDYIIHSAGMSAPAFFLADPLGTIDVNVNGIRWILEYAKKERIKSILYMSSGEVYGNPSQDYIPTSETYNGNVSTIGPRSPYTSSKRLAETLCNVYFKEYRVPVKIARPFIVYGPGLTISDRRVMADFIRSGINAKPIEMLSEGLDTRSYCYVADATVAFLQLLLSNKNGEIFNIASDLEEVNIRELANLVHKICNIKVEVRIRKEDANFIKGAPNRVFPDITKLKKTFNFKPKIGIEEGLRRTIEWNRQVYQP